MKLTAISLRMLLALSVASGLCAQTTPATSHGLLVKIHLYSGRPDPEFRITDSASITKIRELLEELSSAEADALEEPVLTNQLGYRGMEIIKLDDATQSLGNVFAFSMNKGRIQMHTKATDAKGITRAGLNRRVDPSRRLEKLILELALGTGKIESRAAERILR